MKLPKPVKVGAHLWKIRRMAAPVPEGAAYDGTEHGCCDFDHQTIWIAPRICRRGGSLLAETLLHELQHAINQHGGIVDGGSEEFITTQSAAGWTQVFKDNPHLLATIAELLHPVTLPNPGP
jgi:hypothetical protein